MKKVLEAERALSAEKARGFEMANESCGKTREQKKKKKSYRSTKQFWIITKTVSFWRKKKEGCGGKMDCSPRS